MLIYALWSLQRNEFYIVRIMRLLQGRNLSHLSYGPCGRAQLTQGCAILQLFVRLWKPIIFCSMAFVRAGSKRRETPFIAWPSHQTPPALPLLLHSPTSLFLTSPCLTRLGVILIYLRSLLGNTNKTNQMGKSHRSHVWKDTFLETQIRME